MGKKSSAKRRPRVPPEAAGVQVNFCKNPACANFGVPAAQKRRRYRKGEPPDQALGHAYTLNGRGRKSALKCQLCGEKPTI